MSIKKAAMPSSAETSLRIKQLLQELPEERANAARLDELRRLFAKLVSSGQLSFDSNTSTNNNRDSPTAKWNAHLLQQHKVFVSQLSYSIKQGRKTAIRTLFGVIAASPQNNGRIHQHLIHVWIQSLAASQDHLDKASHTMVQGEFLQPYRDVQYSVLVAIAKLAAAQQQQPNENDEMKQQHAERLFQLLLMIPIPTSLEEMEQGNCLFPQVATDEGESHDDDDDDESSVASDVDDQDSSEDESSSDDEETNQLHASRTKKRTAQSRARKLVAKQYNAHKRALAHAWLAVLKLSLPTSALKMALQFLPSNILPHVPKPLLFADFFMQAYTYTGSNSRVVAVLSLDGLFLLMTRYGLDYPLFYTSLYRLLHQQPSIFYLNKRTPFLQLLQKCLFQNDLLPGHVVAAFVKILLRTALVAPPPGILVSLALVSNLLRKYPQCAALIHRDNGATSPMEKDPFDAETTDPTQTRALESSLWELSALEHHYYPPVATLATSIGTETSTTPLHNVDEFVRHSYTSLLEQERKPHKRRKVAVTFVEPKGLFASSSTDNDENVLEGMLELN